MNLKMNSPEREKRILGLVFSGDSIIDWPCLSLSSQEEARHLLKINEYDLEQTRDRDRLMAVHNEAVGYLKNQLRLDLPEEITRADQLEELFLLASAEIGSPLQKAACSLLKSMNIINHIDGRELLYNAPISTRDLYNLVDDKIERELSLLARRDIPGIRYEGGRKSKESLVTKLIAKRETIAAQINDRVRYRIVTPKRDDILKVMTHLFATILPYNYLIPNASANNLIPPQPFLGWKKTVSLAGYRLLKKILSTDKEYSGKSYRVLKFAVDMPVRLDRFLGAAQRVFRTESLGSIAYVVVEFQLVDEETAQRNDWGENAHALYKTRQKSGVAKRLWGGAV